MDGHGDACDPCPMSPNPGSLACPRTIYSIKNGTTAAGQMVSLPSTLVTAVTANGFFLQMAPTDAGYMGSDYSGIFVHAPMNMVTAGFRVTVTSGTVTNYMGELELDSAAFTIDGAGGEASPAPVVAMSTEIATGGSRAAQLEGVIVQIAGATVTDVMPALGPGDTAPSNEFVVDGALRVDDLLYLVTPFPVVGQGYTSIGGVLAMHDGDSTLEPRDATDLAIGAPVITSFAPALSYVDVGQMGVPTIPTPLTVTLSSAPATDTFVTITSGDPTSLTIVGGGVTIAAGTTSAPVLVNGLGQSPSVTLTATLGASMLGAQVRVLGATEVPSLTALSPATATLAPGGTQTYTVTLDLPAPAGGTTVNLMVAPATAGTLPAMVLVPAGQVSATFDYTDGSTTSSETVTASLGAAMFSSVITIVTPTGTGLIINEVDYDQVGTDTAEFVEIYNSSAAPIPLTGVSLVMVNGSTSTVYTTVDLAPAGTINPGQYLVVGATSVVSTVPMGTLVIDAGAVTNYIQNGSPDGLALVYGGMLLDALSYEGSITAATIAGVPGTVSLVEGTALATSVADSNTVPGSLSRLPNGVDTNDAATDWALSGTPTPGTANVP
jgi:hypothetical protein